MCWQGDQQNGGSHTGSTHIMSGYGANNVFQSLYFHGWTHKTYGCYIGGDGSPTGSCDGAIMVDSDNLFHTVIDGSDTDGASGIGIAFSCLNIEYSVFRYLPNEVLCNGAHLFHDNWMDHTNQSGDGMTHSNAQEFPINEYAGDNYFYNNVWSNNFIGTSGVTTWFTPHLGFHDYIFNNILWNNPGGQIDTCGVGRECQSGGTAVWYNNTIADSSTWSPNRHSFYSYSGDSLQQSGNQHSRTCRRNQNGSEYDYHDRRAGDGGWIYFWKHLCLSTHKRELQRALISNLPSRSRGESYGIVARRISDRRHYLCLFLQYEQSLGFLPGAIIEQSTGNRRMGRWSVSVFGLSGSSAAASDQFAGERAITHIVLF